ncbi:MAG: hypothetical protein ACW98K_07805 [Candidatus Kariarchaeaceae archaeon]
MKRLHLLFILYIIFFILGMTSFAQAQTNNKTYSIIYDEAHEQYFTHDLMNTALTSLNSSLDTDDLDVSVRLIINEDKFTKSSLQGGSLLIISNPGAELGISAEDDPQSIAIKDFHERGGSIFYMSNPFSNDPNVTGNGQALESFIDQVLNVNIRRPAVATDGENVSIIMDDFNNDGDSSHVYLYHNNSDPGVFFEEINDISDGRILYYGTSIESGALPLDQIEADGSSSSSTYSVDKDNEMIIEDYYPNFTPHWMMGRTHDDLEGAGRSLLIGSTVMFSDYSYDDTSSWVEQANNLQLFQNIIAWLLQITPLEGQEPIVSENFSFFVRFNLLAAITLGGGLFLIVFVNLAIRNKQSIKEMFNVRIAKTRKTEKTAGIKADKAATKAKKKKSKKRRKRT